jgi:mannan endo-1,4-beta-mannosidase
MRWPNRHPHTLTHGMRLAQKHMVGFLDHIHWPSFRRRNLSCSVKARHFHAFACGDEAQALVWLLRRDQIAHDKCLRRDAVPVTTSFTVPGLADGSYRVRGWDTETGTPREDMIVEASGGALQVTTSDIVTDRAYAITRV